MEVNLPKLQPRKAWRYLILNWLACKKEWDIISQMPLSFSLKLLVLMEYSGCILEEGERERPPQENSRMLLHLSLGGYTRREAGCIVIVNGLLWTVLRNRATPPLALPGWAPHPTPKGSMAKTVQHFIQEKCPIKTQMWIKAKPHQILCFIVWP